MQLIKKIVFIYTFVLHICGAISIQDIVHNNREIFYVNPSAGEIKIKTRKNSIEQTYVVIDAKYAKMNIVYQDENFDYFAADFGSFDTTIGYYFVVKDGLDSLLFPPIGKFKPGVHLFIPPNWASGKTYYTIFTDGFYNGDLTNDPEKKNKWGSKPEKWLPYGGDLMGIIVKLLYLDSLDFDILFLQSIFTASSNHKLNPADYGAVDPAFGDTTDIKIIINEIHKRKKKIILAIILTHTGVDFPAFVDIIKNGNNSKYYNWYLIKSTPVKISPAHYDCWRSDPRFPKLNLNEPQVKNYLFGYLEYWRHFGFDGFYIGEDEQINNDFIEDLRAYLKTKYPGLLLLGSETQNYTGEGLDGFVNLSFRELIINYFIKNTITTSDFDREIRKLLFFNPAQVNCLNLLGLTNYDVRIGALAQQDIIKNLYAFIFTFCGSPAILYGDEIGMTDSSPLNMGSFNWNSEKQNRALLQEIKKFINIRKTNSQISSKYFFSLYVNDITKVYAYDRGGLITILNSGESQSYVVLPAWDGSYLDLISGEKFIAFSQTLKLSINPKSYRILKREI